MCQALLWVLHRFNVITSTTLWRRWILEGWVVHLRSHSSDKSEPWERRDETNSLILSAFCVPGTVLIRLLCTFPHLIPKGVPWSNAVTIPVLPWMAWTACWGLHDQRGLVRRRGGSLWRAYGSGHWVRALGVQTQCWMGLCHSLKFSEPQFVCRHHDPLKMYIWSHFPKWNRVWSWRNIELGCEWKLSWPFDMDAAPDT